MKNLNHYVAIYKEQLEKGDILIAYNHLVKFVMKIRTGLIKSLSHQYSFSGILHGYMDYTYFYYTNEYLKNKKLKLGLVLNHLEMRFEIWLLGNTADVQRAYWKILKDTKWNKDREKMPKFSITEVVIEEHPNFDNLLTLEEILAKQLIQVSYDLISEIKRLS